MSAVLDEPTVEFAQATRIDSMITYPVSKGEIATLSAKFSGLKADTPKGYEQVRLAIGQCRELRVKVEKRRKELKQDSLEFGRKVDSVAKFLTSEIERVEEPLALLKSEVDNEKARKKAEEEAAERARVEAELKARAEAHEAKLRAEREAEEAKIREEQAKLKAEREAMEAKQKAIEEANRIEREKLEAERKRIEDEAKAKQAKVDVENAERQRKLDEAAKAIAVAQEKAEREEFERQAKLKAEQAAKEKAEAERIAKEKADADHKAWMENERVRLEALKPDIAKVHEFAKAIRSLSCPGLNSDSARDAVHQATTELAEIAEKLEAFQAEIPY